MRSDPRPLSPHLQIYRPQLTSVLSILHRITGVGILNQSLGYLMRSGAPDSLDRMVAMSYANLALDLILRRDTGYMVSLQSGCYTAVPLDAITKRNKRVDVEELYDSHTYRPKVAHQMGKPMFLY